MKTNKEPPSNRKVKFQIIMASLILIERGFMVSGIKAVPENFLPPKLKRYQSTIRRVHLTFGLVTFSPFLISLACFALFQAKTFGEYAEVGMFIVGAIPILTFYASFVWQSSDVSAILTDLKDTVEQRE